MGCCSTTIKPGSRSMLLLLLLLLVWLSFGPVFRNRKEIKSSSFYGCSRIIERPYNDEIEEGSVALKNMTENETKDETSEDVSTETPDNDNSTESVERSVDLLYYNRVPKTGSENLAFLISHLAKLNNFSHTRFGYCSCYCCYCCCCCSFLTILMDFRFLCLSCLTASSSQRHVPLKKTQSRTGKKGGQEAVQTDKVTLFLQFLLLKSLLLPVY